MMELTYKNILIRNAEEEDASLLARWWNSGSVMAHAGFPLLGDGKYGTERSRRKYQALFSYKLVFTLSDYQGILSYLKGKKFVVTNVDFAEEYFPDINY